MDMKVQKSVAAPLAEFVDRIVEIPVHKADAVTIDAMKHSPQNAADL